MISVFKRDFQNFSEHLACTYLKGVSFSMEGIRKGVPFSMEGT